MGIKSDLEILLQKLQPLTNFKNHLEQYPTDASNAAYFLIEIYNDGNITGKSVIDAGTGNGILACGARFLGAGTVSGFDIDPEAIEVARRNCVNVNFFVSDVSDVVGKYDTWIMNPPFGSVIKHSDRSFIDKAFETSKWIYSIGNARSRDFLKTELSSRGEIFREERIYLSIPRIYRHHTSDWMKIEAVIFGVKNHSF
ncbi:RNA methyltransferase [Thermoplasma sp. Kam2015]|uniref:METTL5 family protein n=1 Tax=Thermoplasma sp. Kam2015 TaxID=2094122 RepID=UPI000D8783DA|nr:METTL5 family protein [Thermoplasma sp. Kam2015]PYB67769.1 RNA methyltransferase [Thermoplasma sp. Kam2015]